MTQGLVVKLIEGLLKDPEARKALSPAAELSADLGLDSLDVLELTVLVEDAFGVAIPDEDLEGVTTVADLVAVVDAARPA